MNENQTRYEIVLHTKEGEYKWIRNDGAVIGPIFQTLEEAMEFGTSGWIQKDTEPPKAAE